MFKSNKKSGSDSNLQDTNKDLFSLTGYKSMVEAVPVNVLVCDLDLTLLYMNKRSAETLKLVEQYLPCRIDEMIGKKIDIFHKNPEHQRKLLADPKNLPHSAHINLGPEVLNLDVNAIKNAQGRYVGAIATWYIVTEQLKSEREATQRLSMLENMPVNVLMADRNMDIIYMNPASRQGLKAIEQYLPVPVDKILGGSIDRFHRDPSYQRGIVSNPHNLPHRGEIVVGAETLALTAASVVDDKGEYLGPMIVWESITQSIETRRKLLESSNIAANAKHTTENVASNISKLRDASTKIGDVINVINSIAEQTNLLALNATIESARAGEAGKGFAVVAQEVKELAKQTADATKGIIDTVKEIQDQTKSAVDSVGAVAQVITEIDEIGQSIVADIERQRHGN